MATYYRFVQISWDDAKSSNFRINLGYQKLTSAANLLLLSLDVRASYDITQHYALSVQLNATPFVGLEIVYLDELFTVLNYTTQWCQRKAVIQRSDLVRVC